MRSWRPFGIQQGAQRPPRDKVPQIFGCGCCIFKPRATRTFRIPFKEEPKKGPLLSAGNREASQFANTLLGPHISQERGTGCQGPVRLAAASFSDMRHCPLKCFAVKCTTRLILLTRSPSLRTLCLGNYGGLDTLISLQVRSYSSSIPRCKVFEPPNLQLRAQLLCPAEERMAWQLRRGKLGRPRCLLSKETGSSCSN